MMIKTLIIKVPEVTEVAEVTEVPKVVKVRKVNKIRIQHYTIIVIFPFI